MHWVDLRSFPVAGDARLTSSTRRSLRRAADALRLAVWPGARVEAVEPRRLLAFSPIGPEFAVNQTVAGRQDTPVVAADADGDFVVAWRAGGGQDGSGDGVYARRYNAAGAAQGSEFRVNTFTAQSQNEQDVATDADGDFVVVWTSDTQDGSSGGIYAQRYSAAGEPRGPEFRVNQTTAGNQHFPSVAMDVDGDFVVAWAGPDGWYDGVYARRYNAAGTPLGAEFQVNSTTEKGQTRPDVAVDADGDFVVAWEGYAEETPGARSYGIFAKRYSGAGQQLPRPAGVPAGSGNEFRVHTTTQADQRRAAVAMDYAGDFVVTWVSRAPVAPEDGQGGIFAQRFTAAGVLAGGEFRVNDTTDNIQSESRVAMDADGDFMVTWTGYFQPADPSFYSIYAKRYAASGAALPPPAGAPGVTGNEFRVNTTTDDGQSLSAVALDAAGDAVVVWESYGQDAPGGYGVYAQRYDESTDTAGPIITGLASAGNDVRPGARLVHAVDKLTIQLSENIDIGSGGTVRLTRDGADASALIDTSVFGFNAATRKYEVTVWFSTPLPDGAYVISILQNLADPAGNLLDGNLDGYPGGGDGSASFAVRSVVPTGPDLRVNEFFPYTQEDPWVASDANGNFVVVWSSFRQSSSGDPDIYARRYNAAGQPQGGEFVVSVTASRNQTRPKVAMDAVGNFVVVWESLNQDGSGYGVYARVFGPTGAPAGGEFLVNQGTSGNQTHPSVAIAPTGGNFVVTWQGPPSAGQPADDIFVRQFSIAGGGTPTSPEFRANTFMTGIQQTPAVAMDSAGDFVVTWDSYGYGVYAKRFDSLGIERAAPAGVPHNGNDFRVNSYTGGSQSSPQIASDADGDFVIAWTSAGQDGDGGGIYAKRYGSAGNELPPPSSADPGVGNEFRVNTTTALEQNSPRVGMDVDGDFVVTWTDVRSAGDADVAARRYGADGTPQGAQFRVNRYTPGSQALPAVSMDADGDFVVAWESYNQAAPDSRWDVYAQRYGPNEAPVTLGIAAVSVRQDAADTAINLWDSFDDPNTADETLTFSVVGNTNPALFTATPVSNAAGRLTLDYAPGQSGEATITVRATDPGGLSVDTAFNVSVAPVAGGPVLNSITVDDGSAQRSQVKSLTLAFDRAVTLAPGVVTLQLLNTGGSGANDGSAPTDASSALANSPTTPDGGKTWVYTFAAASPFVQRSGANSTGSLIDGVYKLSVDPTKVTAGGVAMSAAPASLTFHRLFGDVNGNRTVNLQDYGQFRSAFGKSSGQAGFDPAFDFDNNGTVNTLDYGQFRGRYGKAFSY